MLLLKRLIAFVVTSVTVLAGRRRRWPRPASRSRGNSACSSGATPVMDDIIWFHNFLLYLITAITLFVLALLVIIVVQVQRPQQSGAVAHHP